MLKNKPVRLGFGANANIVFSAWLIGLAGFALPAQSASSDTDRPYLHQRWITENGLPQNSVTAVVQTRDGHLWLGTFGGLVRFDGIGFTVFNTINTAGLRSNRIRALYEDSEGSLWIGTEHGGLARFRAGVFTNFSVQDGLPDDIIVSVTGGAEGDLWVATTSGIARFRGGKFTLHALTPALQRESMCVVYGSRNGDLWIGTCASGLIRLRGGIATAYTTKDGLPDNRIRSLYEDRQRNLWTGTLSGAARFNGEKFSALRARDHGTLGEIMSFCEDSQNGLWVGSSRGLFRWEGGELIRFEDEHLPNDASIRSLLVDREENLWIGTDAVGLNRLRKGSLIAYTAKRGLTDRPTMPIYQDRQGTLWIGALTRGGLFRFRNGGFEPYGGRPIDRIEAPASLAEDHEGNLWIGDWVSGLTSLKDGRLTHHSIPGMPAGDAIRSLYADRQGVVWIGSDQSGLYQFKDGKFINYSASNGLLSTHVAFITQATTGGLWLGTSVGISRFQDGHFTNYRAPGLSLVRTIYEDADKGLWIGTYGFGLSRFKDGKFAQITSKSGLFDDVVSCILEDNRGSFWMSGNRGIFRVSRNELNEVADGLRKSVNSVSYGVADGMEVSETNGGGEPTCWKARDSKLWFAMIKGVVAIDPNVTNTLPPPVVIEKVIIEGQAVSPGDAIRVKPGQQNLEVHYAGLSFSRPEQVQFKYKLTGLDQDWVNAETRRTAYFPHLPPGEYTFNVIAENGDGVWNTRGASLAITVIPPFWRTGWFVALSVVGIVGTCGLAYRLRVAHLMKAAAAREAFSRQLLDSQERERQRIAAELHDSLGQSLLIIKNRALLALNANGDQEPAREQLDEISSSASQAVEEVREICYNLRPYQLDRFGLTKTLNGICQRAARISGIEFRADLEPLEGLFSNEIETSLYRIVQEGINNVVKHSQATDAELVIRRAGNELHIRFQDNGKGFTPPANAAGSGRDGFGLIGIAERVRMLGGTHTIESAPGRGTLITIRLPIRDGADAS